MENTSGMGQQAQVPEEIKGWSWGAFFLNWIWGLFNNTFIALLCFVPCVGWIMPFVLGVKGREWAWRNKKWESISEFKRIQKIWGLAGLGLFVFFILFAVGIFFLTITLMKQSEGFQLSFQKVQNESRVIAMIGSPIQAGFFVGGNTNSTMGKKEVNLSYSISGPKGEAQVYFKANKILDQWEIERFLVLKKGSGEKIELGQKVDTPSPEEEP